VSRAIDVDGERVLKVKKTRVVSIAKAG
jgi:hypothetical protein